MRAVVLRHAVERGRQAVGAHSLEEGQHALPVQARVGHHGQDPLRARLALHQRVPVEHVAHQRQNVGGGVRADREPEAHHVAQLVDVVRGHHQHLGRLVLEHALARVALIGRERVQRKGLVQPGHPRVLGRRADIYGRGRTGGRMSLSTAFWELQMRGRMKARRAEAAAARRAAEELAKKKERESTEGSERESKDESAMRKEREAEDELARRKNGSDSSGSESGNSDGTGDDDIDSGGYEDGLDYDELTQIIEAIQESMKSDSDAVLKSVRANQERFARVMHILTEARERRKNRQPKSTDKHSAHGSENDKAAVIDSSDRSDNELQNVMAVLPDRVRNKLFINAMYRSEVSLMQKYVRQHARISKFEIASGFIKLSPELMRHISFEKPAFRDEEFRAFKVTMQAWADNDPSAYGDVRETEVKRIVDVTDDEDQFELEDTPDPVRNRLFIAAMHKSERRLIQTYMRQDVILKKSDVVAVFIAMASELIKHINLDNRANAAEQFAALQRYLNAWAEDRPIKPDMTRFDEVPDDGEEDENEDEDEEDYEDAPEDEDEEDYEDAPEYEEEGEENDQDAPPFDFGID